MFPGNRHIATFLVTVVSKRNVPAAAGNRTSATLVNHSDLYMIKQEQIVWIRVLQKLTVAQTYKKTCYEFYGTRRHITVFTAASHWTLS
jgi:hypothetical protein